MKIRCKIYREAGNIQPIGDQYYDWNPANGHVCEVSDPEHIAILLAIKDGYEPADESEANPVSAPDAAVKQRPGRKPKKVADAGEAVV